MVDLKKPGIGLTVVFLFLSLIMSFPIAFHQVSAEESFTFGAAGDLSQNANTNASLARLASSKPDLFLALGDLSYTTASSETHWCNIVKSFMGQKYPFELLSGNHEDGGEVRDGFIGNFTKCLPNQIQPQMGDYGKEYYFDYPPANPLARVIMISPGLNFSIGGGNYDFYDYGNGTSHYLWTAAAIDGARALDIPWVIVGMHKVCVSAGAYECNIGPGYKISPDIIKLLLLKHVDLVLQGHDHNYQRSKQIDCISPDQVETSCIVNSGTDGFYNKGGGTVFVIDGTFGASDTGYDIHTQDPDAQYFARFISPNLQGSEYGFVSYTISRAKISAQTNLNGKAQDSFQIGNPGLMRTLQLFFSNPYAIIASMVGLGFIASTTSFLIIRRKRKHENHSPQITLV